jgi:5'/3'-nucleotidase
LSCRGQTTGDNLGDFAYTGSGTIGTTYFSIRRGIPGIAFSANYLTTTPYYEVNTTTKARLKDPATIAGELAASLVQSLILKANGEKVLPLGYGLNVNMPYITSFDNDSCIIPPFIHTRLKGDAWNYGVKLNTATGLFAAGLKVGYEAAGINVCINGDCGLIDETALIAKGCYSAVSVFTVDYDPPSCGKGTVDQNALLGSVVQSFNSTNVVGELNGTATTGSNGTVTTKSPSAVVTSGAGTWMGSCVAVGFGLAVAIMLLV